MVVLVAPKVGRVDAVLPASTACMATSVVDGVGGVGGVVRGEDGGVWNSLGSVGDGGFVLRPDLVIAICGD